MGEPSGRLRLSVIFRVLSPSTSAPVNTAMTPGALRAAVASIARILAWACVERTTAMWTWQERFTS